MSLAGKTIVITGATSGIGVTAIQMAKAAGASLLRGGAFKPRTSPYAYQGLGEEGLKAYGSMTALQHMGDPAEVGAAAAFLASSDSSFMTGSEVAVDGGLAQI